MDYRFLREWVNREGKNLQGFVVSDIKRFENSFAIYFRNKSTYLQIVLESTNPFIFCTQLRELSFKKDSRTDTLNQHLSHGKIVDVFIASEDDTQECTIDTRRNDRIIFLSLTKVDIYNKSVRYILILELIPHTVNLILTRVKKEKLLIIDCWRYVTLSANSSRQILPGFEYSLPPMSVKRNETEREYLSPVRYPLRVGDLLKPGKGYEQAIAENKFNDLNRSFEFLFYEVLLKQKQERLRNNMLRSIQKQKRRKEKKLANLQKEYEESKQAEDYRKMAELLKSNLHQIRKGLTEIIVLDYFAGEGDEIIIPLQKELNPAENMKLLFRKYRKGISGKEAIKKQMIKTEEEIELLEREIFDLENNLSDTELTKEMSAGEEPSKKGRKQKRERFKRLKIDENWEIFIGRTNKENDELSCKNARPDDWWFHSRVFRGAHIVLRNYNKLEISNDLILLCCRLAAYFSKAKNSENVPVDYTQIRFVSKPHGSPPGFVVYKNQKTMFVNPISLREASKLVNG